MAKKAKSKSLLGRKIFALAIAAAIIAGAALLFVNRDKIGAALGTGKSTEKGEAWVFETGSSQVFARAGNGLAVASSTGLQLLGSDGYTVCRHVCALEKPAVAACSKGAAVYDIGGRTLRFSDMGGTVTELDTEGNIISVSMNDAGYTAVVTESAGCKGLVRVYDPELTPLYEWYSGTGYLLSAAVSPDGKSLAVLTAAEDGGYIRVFSLSSEEEKGSFVAPGELLIDLVWTDSDMLCAISQTRAVFLDGDGELHGAYDFAGLYIVDYSLDGDGFIALALSKYLSGSASLVVTVGESGEALGTFAPESELKSIDACGKHVAILSSDGAAVYSPTLSRQGGTEDIQGVKRALLRKKGDTILVYSASAIIKSL